MSCHNWDHYGFFSLRIRLQENLQGTSAFNKLTDHNFVCYQNWIKKENIVYTHSPHLDRAKFKELLYILS